MDFAPSGAVRRLRVGSKIDVDSKPQPEQRQPQPEQRQADDTAVRPAAVEQSLLHAAKRAPGAVALSRWRWAAIPLLAAALSMLASMGVVENRTWSLFDEYTHFDYVSRVSQDLDLPQANDGLSELAIQVAVCEQAPGFEGLYARCGTAIALDETPYQGLSTATSYLPVYYVTTGLLARALEPIVRFISPGHETTRYVLASARLVGTFYLGLLAFMLVLVGRRLGARSLPAAAAAVLACANPIVLLQFSTVNNDQFPVLLGVGALLAWLTIGADRAGLRMAISYGLAGLAMMGKENALIALMALVVMHLIELRGSSRSWRKILVPLGLAAAVLAATQVAKYLWPLLVGVRPGNNAMIDWIRAQGEPTFAAAASQAITHFTQALTAPIGPLSGPWFAATGVILGAAIFGVLLRISMTESAMGERGPLWALATTTWVFLLGFPILFLVILVFQGMPLFHQPRYLMPGMVMALVTLAPGITRRAGQVLVVAVAAYYIWAMFTILTV